MIIYLSSRFFYEKCSIGNASIGEHGGTFSSAVICEDIFLKAIECRRATPARDHQSIPERGVCFVKTHDARRASHRFGRSRFRRARRDRLEVEVACLCYERTHRSHSVDFGTALNAIHQLAPRAHRDRNHSSENRGPSFNCWCTRCRTIGLAAHSCMLQTMPTPHDRSA
jgi:hypothetical protein